jgi:DNA-binding CsgD family transcriptional regulator
LRGCGQQRIVRQENAKVIIPASEDIQRELFLQSTGIESTVMSQFLQKFERLTPRENECLGYLLKESTTANIAAAMNISIRTAETHIERIKTKLHCRTKNELIIKLLSLRNIAQK